MRLANYNVFAPVILCGVIALGGCSFAPKASIEPSKVSQSPTIQVQEPRQEPLSQTPDQPSAVNSNCTEDVKTYISASSDAPVTALFRDDCLSFADGFFKVNNSIGSGDVHVVVDSGTLTRVSLEKTEGTRFDQYVDQAITQVSKDSQRAKIKSRFYINLDDKGQLTADNSKIVDYNY